MRQGLYIYLDPAYSDDLAPYTPSVIPTPLSAADMAATTLSYHLYTLFLFTKSDMKALVLPAVSDVCTCPTVFFSDGPHRLI